MRNKLSIPAGMILTNINKEHGLELQPSSYRTVTAYAGWVAGFEPRAAILILIEFNEAYVGA